MAWLENAVSLPSDSNGYANFTNLTVKIQHHSGISPKLKQALLYNNRNYQCANPTKLTEHIFVDAENAFCLLFV